MPDRMTANLGVQGGGASSAFSRQAGSQVAEWQQLLICGMTSVEVMVCSQTVQAWLEVQHPPGVGGPQREGQQDEPDQPGGEGRAAGTQWQAASCNRCPVGEADQPPVPCCNPTSMQGSQEAGGVAGVRQRDGRPAGSSTGSSCWCGRQLCRLADAGRQAATVARAVRN